MRRILLAIELFGYSEQALESILSEPSSPGSVFRIALVAPRFNQFALPSHADRLGLPTAAFVTPRFAPSVATFAHDDQRELVNRAYGKAKRLAHRLKPADCEVETVMHEGSMLLAVRSEVREWRPSKVIVAVNSWNGLKRRLVEFAVRWHKTDNDDSNEAGPPVMRKRAA